MGVSISTHEGLLLFGFFEIFLGVFYLVLYFFFNKIRQERPLSKAFHFSYSMIYIVTYFGLILLNWYLELPGSAEVRVWLNIPFTLFLIALIFSKHFKRKTPTDVFGIVVGVGLVILGIKTAFVF